MSVANNLTGKTLNKRYAILRPLGKGGMGKVYLAKDTRFGKQVVVKVPTIDFEDKDFKARFMREIASLAGLEHPHIVTTVDWGEIEGIPFLVLRYLGGGSLRDRITDSQGLKKLMPLEGLNQWLPQIASALDFIHSKKWVHRDLKPDNILFDEAGNPYLADFGIAKPLEGAPMGVKTTMGAFIGTPQYMAPEMHLDKGIGPRADQFGLAVLVYESIAGKIPFTGETSTAIFLDVMRGKPKLIHELVSEISLEKSNALMKGLAKDQNKRHDNCGLFASEITGIKLGTGQVFQDNGEVSISGQIEPLQMKPPIKTGFPVIPDEAPPSMPELAVTNVVRKGVIPLASEMPVKVKDDESYIGKRQKKTVSIRAVLWVGGVIVLVTALALITLPIVQLTLIFPLKAMFNAETSITKEKKADPSKDINIEMLLIPDGTFMMGSPKKEKDRRDDETQHEVTLTKPYYMGKYEVTQEQWESVMGNNPSEIKGVKLPVTNVSWADCQEFIKKLNTKTSGGYRLPTEAEWEFACRAGTTTAYSFDDLLPRSDSNINGSSVKAVGSYNSNAFGLYDMHGNVWEWCEDWKSDYPTKSVSNPKGPVTGEYRVLRGGSFRSDRSNARSSFRGRLLTPVDQLNYIGFRLARTAEIKTDVPEPTITPETDIEKLLRALRNPKPETDIEDFLRTITDTKKLLRTLRNPKLESEFTYILPKAGAAKTAQIKLADFLQKEVKEKANPNKDVKIEMLLIPDGNFMMGSDTLEKGRSDNETEHEVTLTKPFYIGKHEVTQEQYEVVMGKNPSEIKGAKLPVTNLSWEDCQEFIKQLNVNTNGGYRLPTEAEWEYACRAGATTAYSYLLGGNRLPNGAANIDGDSIEAVGNYTPNAFGLYDMHGNVNEWCEDWYGDYQAGAVIDPKGPATGKSCVLRGGSFSNSKFEARSSNRHYSAPTARDNVNGFRLAKNPSFHDHQTPSQ
jgi:serine/threonine-protein kinase